MFTRLVVEEISPSHLVSIRLLLAALLLGPLFINKEEFLKMSKVIPSLILLGIINAALPFFLFAWSAQELTALEQTKQKERKARRHLLFQAKSKTGSLSTSLKILLY